ncbi:MAG: ion transporter [Actinomycetota bacterium]|nr:ion transporter [Actinomycetota bacterium]
MNKERYKKIKLRVYQVLEKAEPEDKLGMAFDIFLIAIIAMNLIVIILNSVISIASNYYRAFRYFEIFSVMVFTIEYLLRLWVSNIDLAFKGIVRGRVKFALTPLAIVDLLAIIPFYLPFVLHIDLRFLRILRLIRLFRIFKFSRYFESMNVLGRLFRKKKAELLMAMFVMGLLLVVVSSLMYQIESRVQPENFGSIPQAMWWGVSAVTPVDFGLRPVTVWGKILSAVVAFLGVGLFAIPAGILSSGLMEIIGEDKKEEVRCPECGKEFKPEE